MNISYTETDNFDETDDFDDEDELEDSYLDAEDDDSVDLEDDLESADTTLSRAFREATAPEVVEDYDEEEDSEDGSDEESVEKAKAEADDEVEAEADDEVEAEADDEVEVEAEAEAEADDDDDGDDEDAGTDTEVYEQQLADAIDALPDEDEADLEVVLPPLELPSLEIELFRPQEQDNFAYADAMTAYYEEKNYQRAIEKFGEAIENEAQGKEEHATYSNEIVAKSMYWQAEAYVKMQDIPQAIVTFESLAQNCRGHYLSLAAQRRVGELNVENS